MRLTRFKVLTFDCYGTLIDWESGMIGGLQPLLGRTGCMLSRDQILQAHAYHESAAQRQTPEKRYAELLAVVYKRLAEEWEAPVAWEECLAYGRSVRNWPAFEDSASALQYLKKHYRLVILSNVDNESFAHSKKKLQVEFDAVYTAEDIGSYKPSPRNFEYMLDQLARAGFERNQVLHTAESMFHDHAPAKSFNLSTCWIHRRHGKAGFGATMRPEKLPEYDLIFPSMADMVKAHQRELEG